LGLLCLLASGTAGGGWKPRPPVELLDRQAGPRRGMDDVDWLVFVEAMVVWQ